MEPQFVDRILTCADCHGEFVFTAGEQLFFYDKQFKNDPKRCKPCKSRRSGLSAAANGTGPAPAGISRTETRTECSECGIQTTVPFRPTQGRPVLCRHCFQLKNRAVSTPVRAETDSLLLTQASTNSAGRSLSPAAAQVAAATMAAASPVSSVATSADLASISGLNAAEPAPHVDGVTMIAAEWMAQADGGSVQRAAAELADAPEA